MSLVACTPVGSGQPASSAASTPTLSGPCAYTPTSSMSGRPAMACSYRRPMLPVVHWITRSDRSAPVRVAILGTLKPGQVVFGDVVNQDLQVILRGTQGVLDRGKPGRIVADRVLRGHADAAVQLDRLLRDVSARPADLQLGPRRDHRVEVAVGDRHRCIEAHAAGQLQRD